MYQLKDIVWAIDNSGNVHLYIWNNYRSRLKNLENGNIYNLVPPSFTNAYNDLHAETVKRAIQQDYHTGLSYTTRSLDVVKSLNLDYLPQCDLVYRLKDMIYEKPKTRHDIKAEIKAENLREKKYQKAMAAWRKSYASDEADLPEREQAPVVDPYEVHNIEVSFEELLKIKSWYICRIKTNPVYTPKVDVRDF
ncbi:MAG: hypothetical protein E7378_03765 [Clostridiales bacterium]|nr:hypothetical protein [Clostridiales bacterium]